MADTKPGRRVQTNLRVPAELLARVDAEADARHVGRNWLLTRLISEGLDRLIPADELTLTRPPSGRVSTTCWGGHHPQCSGCGCSCHSQRLRRPAGGSATGA